jgi:hypothetical protein
MLARRSPATRPWWEMNGCIDPLVFMREQPAPELQSFLCQIYNQR